MKFKAVIFDLDGTLLNTIDDISDAANAALSKMGLPPHMPEQYKNYVGEGTDKLAKLVLPQRMHDKKSVDRCMGLIMLEYAKRWDKKTKPYDGIKELLEDLCERKLKLAIFSNKPDAFTKMSVQKYFPKVKFNEILGAENGFPKKPDPAGALAVAKKIKAKPAECLFVGDSNVDMQTASNAGMYPIGVLWGFRSKKELLDNGAKKLISKPDELIELI